MITDAINLVGQPDFSHKILSLPFYACTYAATVINKITTNKKTYIAVLCILLNVIPITFIDFFPLLLLLSTCFYFAVLYMASGSSGHR